MDFCGNHWAGYTVESVARGNELILTACMDLVAAYRKSKSSAKSLDYEELTVE
jgi:hypothetical protein